MDLSLSRRGDYVIRAAISLARAYGGGSYRKIREVAEEMSIPPRYTPQILNVLLKAGVAEARAGQKGGYRLTVPPSDIPLLTLVEAAEGSLRAQTCTLRGGPCEWDQMCPVHPTWQAAYEALSGVLSGRSLASVTAVDADLAQGTYVVTDSHRSPSAVQRKA